MGAAVDEAVAPNPFAMSARSADHDAKGIVSEGPVPYDQGMPPPSGAFLIDKPIGESSRTTLDALERTLKIGPLGHTGTLDPLATGLLIVLVGTARRLQELMLGSTKVYDAELTFGATSETLDGEGPITTTGDPVPALEQALPPAIASFIGDLQQIPPAHSAVHVDGKRAYSLARMGTDPKLKPRGVRVDAIEVIAAAATTARLHVTCGPGTYIRSLARDIGQALGCGAYLSALRRVGNGRFQVANAVTPDAATSADLVPMAEVLAPFTRIDVDRQTAAKLSLGQTAEGLEVPADGPAFAWLDGEPVCRLRQRGSGGRSDLRLREILESER